MNLRRWAARLSRFLLSAAVVLLIITAVVVVLGRQLLPAIDNYRSDIDSLLSRQSGLEVSTRSLSGSWSRLSPRVVVRGLTIAAPPGQGAQQQPTIPDEPAAGAIHIERLVLELDLLRSLLAAEPVWHELSLGHIAVNLREQEDGAWSLEGLPPFALVAAGTAPANMSGLLDRLLLNRFIGVEKISLNLGFYSGVRALVNFTDLKLENEAGFHRITAGLGFDDNPALAELIVEAKGDLVSPETAAGEAYLVLQGLNFSGSLRAVVGQWFPELASRMGEIESELASEIWLRRDQSGQVDLVGRLEAEEIPLSWAADLPPVKNLSAQVTGWFQPGENWGLRWQNLNLSWADTVIQPLNFMFSQRVGARWSELSLAANHINLATLKQALVSTGLVTGTGSKVLDTLDPKGSLVDLHIDLDMNEDFPLQALRSGIEHLDLNSWGSTPATRNLSGYLAWQGQQGTFELDSPDGFAMGYPGVYEDFMQYGASRGRVDMLWQRETATLKIGGGPIAVEGEGDEGRIRAYLSLDIPLNKGPAPTMWLLAGIRDSHSRHTGQYLPSVLDPGLRAWLDRAVGDAKLVEAGFLWRGSLVRDKGPRPSVQVYAKVADGMIDYDPGWPRLTDLSAYITVDNGKLKGHVNSANLGDSRQVQLTSARVSTSPGPLLLVNGEVSTPLSEATDILLASPVRERVSMLAGWRFQGSAQVRLDLAIPLASKRDGEHYRVAADISRGQMGLVDFPLVFESISGLVAYSDERGLYSSGLKSRLWGQPLKATITTTEGETRIESEGRYDIARMPPWHPLLGNQVSGASDYQAMFVVPVIGSPYLRFTSSTEGLVLALPEPLNKAADSLWPLTTKVNFTEDLSVDGRLGQDIGFSMRLDKGRLVAGQVALGGAAAQVAGLTGVSLIGQTPEINLDAWLQTFQAMKSPAAEHDEPDLPLLTPRFSLRVDELIFRGLSVTRLEATGSYDGRGLDVYLDSEILAGQVVVPAMAGQPIAMNLDYLTLPKPDLDSENGFLDGLDPRGFPHLKFATGGIRVGDEQLGELAFLMRPLDDGVELSQIDAELTGIDIGDLPGGEPAAFSWRQVDGRHKTHLTGLLKTHDLGAVLKAWNLPVVVNSDEAASIVDLSWNGKPWEFDLEKLSGQAALNFKDGNFFRAPGATSNAFIKLISLINFDTWARRLRLDFTDLFASGVSYESLKGGLAFAEGTMGFDAPVVVELPSGKMRLTGRADLVNETLDAHMVATLPVGTNLPWIAALVGGLPAAAGVYLTSKIFEDEVDRVSSFSYRVTGPWGKPEVRVDKVFSDKTDE